MSKLNLRKATQAVVQAWKADEFEGVFRLVRSAIAWPASIKPADVAWIAGIFVILFWIWKAMFPALAPEFAFKHSAWHSERLDACRKMSEIWNVRQDEETLKLLHEALLDSDRAMNLAALEAVTPECVGKMTDQRMLAAIAKNRGWTTLRVAAIQRLTDQAVLADLAGTLGEDDEVRIAAVNNLTDQAVLAELAKNEFGSLRDAAVARLTDQKALAEVAIAAKWSSHGEAIVKRITDPLALAEVAKKGRIEDVRGAALEKLTDSAALVDVVHGSSDVAVRRDAALKLTKPSEDVAIRKAVVLTFTDQAVLAEVAKYWGGYDAVRLAALGKLTDTVALADIARNSWGTVSTAAKKRLASLK